MTKRSKGTLFVISAPSGAGKTTLCRHIAAVDKRLRESVSYTSRQPRKGERNNRDYTFVGTDEFRKMAAGGEFVEWAEVHGNLYGTSRKRLKDILAKGFDVLLDIDIQGAAQIRKAFPAGVSIFVMPPSRGVLRRRLEGRGANTKADMERRLKNAVREMKNYKKYDYVIVNDVLNDAVSGLRAIIASERLRTARVDGAWIRDNFFC